MRIVIKDRFYFSMRSRWFAVMMVGLFAALAFVFFTVWQAAGTETQIALGR